MAMAFTTTDRDNIQAAMVVLAVEGIAETTVGGQTVKLRSLDEARRLLDMINNELAGSSTNAGLGLRFRKFTPTYQ